MDSAANNILPVGGGIVGALVQQTHVVVEGLLPTIAFAIVGAIVGYFIKMGLDSIFKR